MIKPILFTLFIVYMLAACLPANAGLFDKGSFTYKKIIKNGKPIAQNHNASELAQWIKYEDKIYYCIANVPIKGDLGNLIGRFID
jgi:hypothetical protein